jgi:hypothetical protein
MRDLREASLSENPPGQRSVVRVGVEENDNGVCV